MGRGEEPVDSFQAPEPGRFVALALSNCQYVLQIVDNAIVYTVGVFGVDGKILLIRITAETIDAIPEFVVLEDLTLEF